MREKDVELDLIDSLEDYRARRAQGDDARVNEYEDPLGESYEDFCEIVEAERALDVVLSPPPDGPLPRSFGPYTLLQELGEGAAGVVYEALLRDEGHRVAVKVLRSGIAADGTAVERFRREAEALQNVSHPNVVKILDAGQVDGCPYYAMELLEGTSLARLCRSTHRPRPEELARGLAGIADALQALHDAGIVHRDVKPSNIIVSPDGHMTLADFGLARHVANIAVTRSGQALGTPLYMSPEQILGQRDDVDARSDVYGLGATLYEALAGRRVFRAEDVRALLRMVISERPVPVRRVAPAIPPAYESVVMKALEKRASDRYVTAGAMRDDLWAIAEGRQPSGRPVSRVRRTVRRVRRHAASAAALLVVLVGGFFAFQAWQGSRDGTLHLSCDVPLRASIEGVYIGELPLEATLAPGKYEIVLEDPRFSRTTVPVEIEAGQRHVVPVALPKLVDIDDRTGGVLVARQVDTDLPTFRKPELERDPPLFRPIRLAAVFPAGRVRMEDVTEYMIEIPVDQPEGMRLVFLRDDKELYSAAYVEQEMVGMNWLPMPPAVVEALQPGDKVTWGLVTADGGMRHTTTFEVVERDTVLEARIAHLRKVLKSQDPALQVYFIGFHLLQHGLPYAAYREAREVAESAEGTEKPSVLPLGVMHEALLDLGIRKTEAGHDVAETIFSPAFTDEQRENWFEPKAGSD